MWELQIHGVEIQEISFDGHSATFNLQDPASNIGQLLIQGYQQPWVIYFYQGRRAQDVHDVSLGSQKVPQLQLFFDVFLYIRKKPATMTSRHLNASNLYAKSDPFENFGQLS